MYGLKLDYRWFPDGVVVVDHGPEKPPPPDWAEKLISRTVIGSTLEHGKSGRWFEPRTGRTQALHLQIADLENPVAVQFVNARDGQAMAGFLGAYGFLLPPVTGWEGQRVQSVLAYRSSVLNVLRSAGGDDPVRGLQDVNRALGSHRSLGLIPALDTGAAPARLMLSAQSLHGFMLMEAAMVAANGARLQSCDHCGKYFLTGSLTGRRSHARFCSDRCRVAAMRARQAKEPVKKKGRG